MGRHRGSLQHSGFAVECSDILWALQEIQKRPVLAPVQPCVGREAAGQNPSPPRSCSQRGAFLGAMSPRPLPQQNQLSAREQQRQKESCRKTGRASSAPDGKIRLQEALFSSPMGRPLSCNRPFDFRTRIKDRRGKPGGSAQNFSGGTVLAHAQDL